MQLSFANSGHVVTRKLAKLIQQKSSNLAVSADITSAGALLKFAENVADTIVILKTHIDIVSDFTPALTKSLRKLADQAGFLIFEDRKFADIGNTVCHQLSDGIYRIAEWADIINAHMLPGPGIIEGLKKGCYGRDMGLLLLAQMSSQGNLFSPEYTQCVVKHALNHKEFVMGFIAQEKLADDKDLVTMTPGVNLGTDTDQLGQKYHSPQAVIGEKKSDIIIVGRGIYAAENPKKIAQEYQRQAWDCLCETVKTQ